MKRHQLLSAMAAIVAFGPATFVLAQTTPQEDETQPRAASSPHQRESTSTEAKEAPTTTGTDTSPSAASTPHQQEATHGKMATGKTKAEREQMMSDCMKKEQARNSSMTADQVRKTCIDQMKMHHGNATQDRTQDRGDMQQR